MPQPGGEESRRLDADRKRLITRVNVSPPDIPPTIQKR